VAEREAWHRRQRAVFQQFLAVEPGDDAAVGAIRAEAVRTLPLMALLRRVIVTAARPR
jgi:hypothetical protein